MFGMLCATYQGCHKQNVDGRLMDEAMDYLRPLRNPFLVGTYFSFREHMKCRSLWELQKLCGKAWRFKETLRNQNLSRRYGKRLIPAAKYCRIWQEIATARRYYPKLESYYCWERLSHYILVLARSKAAETVSGGGGNLSHQPSCAFTVGTKILQKEPSNSLRKWRCY